MPNDEDAILKVLQALEEHKAILHEIVQKARKLDHQEQMLNIIGQDVRKMRQDVRMVRAAINDMERTRFTSGEAEVIHEDLNRLQDISIDLRARVAVLEETTSA